MSTQRYRVRAELLERLRRFEWDLARDEHARSARKLLRGRTHELLNFVQIVDLGTRALIPHTQPAGDEFIADLQRASGDARNALRELQALAHAEERAPAHSLAEPCVRRALDQVRAAVDSLEAQVLVEPDATVAWSPEELELLIVAIALDGERDQHVELLARTREIGGRRCLEIVCGPILHDGMGARLAMALAARVGGDAAVAERRGGGHELAVAAPLVPVVG